MMDTKIFETLSSFRTYRARSLINSRIYNSENLIMYEIEWFLNILRKVYITELWDIEDILSHFKNGKMNSENINEIPYL